MHFFYSNFKFVCITYIQFVHNIIRYNSINIFKIAREERKKLKLLISEINDIENIGGSIWITAETCALLMDRQSEPYKKYYATRKNQLNASNTPVFNKAFTHDATFIFLMNPTQFIYRYNSNKGMFFVF